MSSLEPGNPQIVVEYGSRSLSAAEPVIEEHEDADEAGDEFDEWEQAVVDAEARDESGPKQGNKAIITMPRRPLPPGSGAR